MFMGRHGDGWQVFNEASESIIAASPKQSDQEHQDNFIECVRSRRPPNASAEQGHYSALLSHLANVSWRVGKKKLAFDGKTETFVGAPEADQYVKRTYRGAGRSSPRRCDTRRTITSARADSCRRPESLCHAAVWLTNGCPTTGT